MKGRQAPFLVMTDVGKKKALEVGEVPDMLDTCLGYR
jgi:hypothetical protein